MKYEGFTLEFVNLIQGFKVEKIKQVINGNSQSKNSDVKNGIKGFVAELLKVKKNELPDYIQNVVMNINVDVVTENLKRIMVDEISLFDSVDSETAKTWGIKLDDLKKDWKDEQKKDEYNAKSLRNKIVREVIKSFEAVESEGQNVDKDEIKKYANRAIDQVWLSLDLQEFIRKLKQNLSPEQKQDVEGKKQIWLDKLKAISDKYNYANWLDQESKNAFNVRFSTHVAKLTHSSISGSASSIYFDKHDGSPDYLSTAALKDSPIDVSQTDNKFSPIGKLLKLQVKGKYFADKLKKKDVSDLMVFAKNKEQAQQWAEGFINSFQSREPSSHSLAKQIYFPVNDEYHLISPLVSSSVDQAIFDRINYAKFNKNSIEVRKQKRENKFHNLTDVSYVNIAILKVTASNHSNASPLNGGRGGKRYLFPSMPPSWKSSIKPPLKQSSMFYGEFDRRAWKSAKSLQGYLLTLQDKESNKHIRDRVKGVVNEIIDTLFSYVVEIQNLIYLAGWSEHTDKLKEAHQLWLDPHRQDEQFQQTRKRSDWQEAVCYDFGRWLNNKLEHDKMKFSKIEAKSWAKILLKRLREFERDLDVV